MKGELCLSPPFTTSETGSQRSKAIFTFHLIITIMKKIILLLRYMIVLSIICNCFFAKGENIVNENFASLQLPTGWTTTGSTAFQANYNGKNCIKLSDKATFTIKPLNKPGILTFSHRTSGAGSTKVVIVEKSTNSGSSWTKVDQVAPSSSTWGSSNFQINEGLNNVLIRFTASSLNAYITDIIVSSVPDPQLEASASSLDLGTVFAGETSGSTSFTIDGSYLSSDITADVSGSGFEISQNGTLFSSSLNISRTSTMPVTLYARYTSPQVAAGTVNGNIRLTTEGLDAIDIPLTVFSSETIPTIITSPSGFSFGYLLFDMVSDSKIFQIQAKYLSEVSGNITITAPEFFEISTDGTAYLNAITLPFNNSKLDVTDIYVRFKPAGNVNRTPFGGNISISGGGASLDFPVSGTGVISMDGISKFYFIAPNGNDNTGNGSLSKPWFTLTKAISVAEAGDTIYCRGGSYDFRETIRITKSGQEGKRIHVFAYKKDDGAFEQPIFDFTNQDKGGTTEEMGRRRGIVHQGDYWYFYGIHITKATDNGVKLEGSYNIYERCTFSWNGDTGIQLGFGHSFQDSHPGISKNNGSYCAYNYIVDCDSYCNYDIPTKGGNADGFACKMHNGKENWFIRCRAWWNSDDAWDLYETDYPVYIIECWGFASAPRGGILAGEQGNGNGIKLGGNGTGGSSVGVHQVWNSVAFNCNKTGSVKGFDQNSHSGGVILVNNLAYGCGYDFMFEKSSSVTMQFYNNVCLGKQEMSSNHVESNNAIGTATTKGWITATTGVSATDYTDLSEDAAKMPRGIDGSLPTGFARLKAGSKQIDTGKDGLTAPLPTTIGQPLVGTALQLYQPVFGNARDMGPYEFKSSTPTSIQQIMQQDKALSLSTYPNPCKNNGVVRFSVSEESRVLISVYNLVGTKVADLYTDTASPNIEYAVPFDVTNWTAGMYICVMKSGNQTVTSKVVVAK